MAPDCKPGCFWTVIGQLLISGLRSGRGGGVDSVVVVYTLDSNTAVSITMVERCQLLSARRKDPVRSIYSQSTFSHPSKTDRD